MTSDQETRVLAMLSAFEAGKKISELDTASGSVSDMRIEVLDTDGESKVMNLSEAVTTAANAVCGRYWNESNSTYRAAGYHGSLDMLRKLPELLGLGCYLVQDDRTGASWIPRTTTVSRTVHRRSWTARWDSICGVGILVFILPSGKWVI